MNGVPPHPSDPIFADRRIGDQIIRVMYTPPSGYSATPSSAMTPQEKERNIRIQSIRARAKLACETLAEMLAQNPEKVSKINGVSLAGIAKTGDSKLHKLDELSTEKDTKTLTDWELTCITLAYELQREKLAALPPFDSKRNRLEEVLDHYLEEDAIPKNPPKQTAQTKKEDKPSVVEAFRRFFLGKRKDQESDSTPTSKNWEEKLFLFIQQVKTFTPSQRLEAYERLSTSLKEALEDPSVIYEWTQQKVSLLLRLMQALLPTRPFLNNQEKEKALFTAFKSALLQAIQAKTSLHPNPEKAFEEAFKTTLSTPPFNQSSYKDKLQKAKATISKEIKDENLLQIACSSRILPGEYSRDYKHFEEGAVTQLSDVFEYLLEIVASSPTFRNTLEYLFGKTYTEPLDTNLASAFFLPAAESLAKALHQAEIAYYEQIEDVLGNPLPDIDRAFLERFPISSYNVARTFALLPGYFYQALQKRWTQQDLQEVKKALISPPSTLTREATRARQKQLKEEQALLESKLSQLRKTASSAGIKLNFSSTALRVEDTPLIQIPRDWETGITLDQFFYPEDVSSSITQDLENQKQKILEAFAFGKITPDQKDQQLQEIDSKIQEAKAKAKPKEEAIDQKRKIATDFNFNEEDDDAEAKCIRALAKAYPEALFSCTLDALPLASSVKDTVFLSPLPEELKSLFTSKSVSRIFNTYEKILRNWGYNELEITFKKAQLARLLHPTNFTQLIKEQIKTALLSNHPELASQVDVLVNALMEVSTEFSLSTKEKKGPILSTRQRFLLTSPTKDPSVLGFNSGLDVWCEIHLFEGRIGSMSMQIKSIAQEFDDSFHPLAVNFEASRAAGV